MSQDSPLLDLYLAHRSELVNYADGIVRDRGSAEDLVQEAWMRLGSASEARTVDDPVRYLYRIVRNLAVDGWRRQARENQVFVAVSADDVDQAADDAPSPEAAVISRDEHRRLVEAMAELPERTRIALEMRRLGGCSLKEISESLGISLSTTHDILAHGIAHCRKRLRPAKSRPLTK